MIGLLIYLNIIYYIIRGSLYIYVILNRLKLIELTLRYHDAQIVSDFSLSKITHVIFDEKDLSRFNEIKEFHEKYVLVIIYFFLLLIHNSIILILQT